MYLRNSWYVVAWSNELIDRPFARTVLEERIVIYRLSDGSVAALEDRCPHRHLPLSMGVPIGDNLQCGYHGLVFDSTGACVAVPSQTAIPANARVKSYPAVERYGWVWVWMGDSALADPKLVPDFHLMTDPAFASVGQTNHVRASYKLMTDNLMDLSHVGYVHTTTIGNAAFGSKGKLTVRRSERGVNAIRLVPDVPPPPTYIQSGRLPAGKNIDRWSIIDFTPPCFVIIHTGGAEAGTGALDGRYDHGFNLWVMNAMTPETATTTNYFWGSVRNYGLGDAETEAFLFAAVSAAFEEDRRVLEAQQAVIDGRQDSWSVALKSDAASIEARRVLEKLIDAESTSNAPAMCVSPVT